MVPTETMKCSAKTYKKKKILIVNCYFDDIRMSVRRKTKLPQSMTAAFLAGPASGTATGSAGCYRNVVL